VSNKPINDNYNIDLELLINAVLHRKMDSFEKASDLVDRDSHEKLLEERDVLEAQRDHYRERCDELEKEIKECKQQLSSKFKTTNCSIDSSIFEDECLERLVEWKKCLNFCIEEKIESMKLKGKLSQEVSGEKQSAGENGGIAIEVGVKGKKGGYGAELPFSPNNLTGFLTRNHRLTQGRTEYPEPKSKSN